jgi:SAM-dependent methyltransferase
MPPVNPFELLTQHPSAMILVDRRGRDFESAALSVSMVASVFWVMPAPLGGDPIQAVLLSAERKTPGFRPPARIETSTASYTRLLDRFYLPDNAGPEVSSALFDAIALHYDNLTDGRTNVAVCRRLLKTVADGSRAAKRILDFGCGTGVASIAGRDSDLAHLSLVGTDASPAMLELARRRGESTITRAEWKREPALSFDGAIAAFVLHLGVPDEDLILLASQLSQGALFAANIFKPTPNLLERILKTLQENGLMLKSRERLDATAGENLMFAFVKATIPIP